MIRIELGDKQVGRRFRFGYKRFAERVGRAAGQTALDAAEEIEDRVRVQIAGAGNFGLRWTRGFKARPTIGNNEILIRATHDIPYWTVHEFGATIKGQPLLWIPLSWTDAARERIRARDYPGGLFRVDRKSGGAPLLLSIATGEPIYSGHESVTIPKRFRMREIIREVTLKMRDIYRTNYKAAR